MNKILKFKKEIICIIIFMSMMFLYSCGIEKLTSIEVISDNNIVYIGNFNYKDYKLILNYDSGRTEEVELTESMISDVDKLKLYTEGNHDIKITYKEKETTFNVNVKRNNFEGVIFDDVETVYTGQDVVMEVKNVPEGTSVSYPGSNKFRNAGTYEVKAILRKDSFEAVELSAKLVIKKADYDLSEVKFEDKTVAYTGSKYNIKVEGNLPSGIAVDYTIAKDGGKEENGNSAQNAGTYVIKATFSGDYNNYNVIEPKYATLTINKASIDMSSVKFNDDVVTYDRQSHSLAIQGNLPAAVSVSYENNNQIDVGEYKILAKFTHRDTINYEAIPDMEATLKINKADYDLSNIHFDSISADYDGKEKNIVLDGVLPTHLKYEFENNGHTDSGTYDVTVKFTNDDPNYNTPEDIKTKIVINPVVANLDDVVFEKTRFVGYFIATYDEDVFIEANAFRPTNLPVGLEIEKMAYYKQNGLLSGSLDAFDGVNGDFVEKITEDGYYVVVATFKDSINYRDVYPVKTQIKVTTALNRYVFLSGYYDPDWRWNTNLSKSILENAQILLEYDDCSVLSEMLRKEANPQTYKDVDHESEVIREPIIAKFDKLAKAFNEIGNTYAIDDNLHEYAFTANNEFMTSLYNLTNDLYSNSLASVKEKLTQDKIKSGVFGINKPYDLLNHKYYIYVKEPVKANLNQYKELIDGNYVATEDTEINPDKAYYQEATYNDYLLMIARLFGYEAFDENKKDITIEKFLANVDELKKEYLEAKDIENRLVFNGTVYTEDKSFILPYLFAVDNQIDGKEYDYVFASYLIIDANGMVSIWINDVDKALEATNISVAKANKKITTYSRCALFEERETGAYCIGYHDVVIIPDADGIERVLIHCDNINDVDIDNADYASSATAKMSFKILTEDDFEDPDPKKIEEAIKNSDDMWSYDDFVKGITVDGSKLDNFDQLFSEYLDLYHGATGIRDEVIDEEGNYISYIVEYPDHDLLINMDGNITVIEKEATGEVKPIVAVKGIKNISNASGEFIVYSDLVDTEGFKMDGAYYATFIIWNI